jgi:type VI protein secretion system component VasK
MERRLLRVLITRLALFAIPFAVYFVWRDWARRSGRPMGATPWAWLFAAGALIAALSLMASVFSWQGRGTGAYVPAQARADGSVAPARSVPRPAP